MRNKITILGALANSGIKNGNEVMTKYLADNIENVKVFRRDTGPGIKNALDWEIALSATASIVTIAGFLWKAYEKFIAPLNNDNAFIFVQVKNESDNKFEQFIIGDEYKDKDVFINSFVSKVENLTINNTSVRIERKSTTTIHISKNTDKF